MKVSITRSTNLPRQAWLLRRSHGAVDVLLGERVTAFDKAFFEGGWALTPGPEALRSAGIHLGSGAAWGTGDDLTLISPSHSLESVWTAETDGAVWAANSLALLVTASRPEGIDIWRARSAIRTINTGLATYRREVLRTPEIRICRFANAFVSITDDGPPVERQQVQEADFVSLGSYVDFVLRVIREAVGSFGGGMSVYLSRGYDSPTVAALARRVGPVTAICIDRTATGADDNGSIVAESLGLPSVLVPRRPRATHVMAGHDWSSAARDHNP